jgi:hypothetical protein
VLLPRHADAALSDPHTLLERTAFRETRRDAQEGRRLVIMLPRAVPTALAACVVAYAIAPWIELGMVAQIDVHEPLASDGVRHPHVHIWISQREVEGAEFGRKNREWNRIFVRQVRVFRASIAARMTQAMAMLGIAEAVDPRSHRVANRQPPSPRLPRHMARQPRQLRALAASRQRLPDLSDFEGLRPKTMMSAATALRPRVASRAIREVCEALDARGDCSFHGQAGLWGISLSDGSRIVACSQYIRAAGPLTTRKTIAVMIALATAMEWTGVILDGPDGFVAEIVDSALRQNSPVMPINRVLPEAATSDMAERHQHRLTQAIAWMDRTGGLTGAIERHAVSQETASSMPTQNETVTDFAFEPFPTPRPATSPNDPASDAGVDLWREHVRRLEEIALAARGSKPFGDVRSIDREAPTPPNEA